MSFLLFSWNGNLRFWLIFNEPLCFRGPNLDLASRPRFLLTSRGPQVAGMLERLTAVPWRRIDVSFLGARMPYTAHNLIQARNECHL